MHRDKKLFLSFLVLLILPIGLAFCGGDRYRYACQDPANWDKDFCQYPKCDVSRTCPEHVFKGQRDPRLGPAPAPAQSVAPAPACPAVKQGVNCGK